MNEIASMVEAGLRVCGACLTPRNPEQPCPKCGRPPDSAEPRAPLTSRAVMAGILSTLADTLAESVENAKAQLLDLQGVERTDCETYIKTATDLFVGMRKDARSLEQEPSRIVKPGVTEAIKPGNKRREYIPVSDGQALAMVRGGKG